MDVLQRMQLVDPLHVVEVQARPLLRQMREGGMTRLSLDLPLRRWRTLGWLCVACVVATAMIAWRLQG